MWDYGNHSVKRVERVECRPTDRNATVKKSKIARLMDKPI